MAFWGCALKPGQKQKVDVLLDEVLHLSQACLNEPKAGKNYVQVQVKGASYTFACLEKDKIEHNALDLFFETEATFTNKGTSEVHLSGYMEPKDAGDDGEEGEEEEEAAAVGSSTKASPKASPKATPAKAAAAATKDDDDDDDDDDEGDMDEMEEGEEEEMEGDESEEAEDEAPPKKAEKSPKRKAEEPAPPSKKTKVEASPKATEKPSGDQIEYIKELVEFLKKNGKAKLSELGSKVKRPAGVPKMKNVLEANKDKFVLSGEMVELKK